MKVRVLLLATCLGSAVQAQQPVGFERTDFPAGDSPAGVALADYDADGDLDAAVVNRDTNSVTVLLNQGDGSFATGSTFATGATPVALAAGDLNLNGALDLLVLAQGTEEVWVHRGAGDGTFAQGGVFEVGRLPVDVVLADLDGDHDLDFVVTNRLDDSLSIGDGNGTGGFSSVAAFDLTGIGESPNNLVLGDLNGDGDLDGVVSTWYGEGTILHGGPGLSFTGVQFPSSFGGHPDWVAMGDVDGDGRLDVVDPENDLFDICTVVWTGEGDGTLSPNWFFTSGSFVFTELGDVDADGDLDVVQTTTQDQVEVMRGDGAGNFAPNSSLPAGEGVSALEVGDLNGDGRVDFLTVGEAAETVSVFLAVPEFLEANLESVSIGLTTDVEFSVWGESEHAGELYWLLGSASGTSPALTANGLTLPLVVDAYFSFLLTNPNTLITDSLGFLDANARATASLTVPWFVDPTLAGLVLHHAHVVLDFPGTGAGLLASDAVPLLFSGF